MNQQAVEDYLKTIYLLEQIESPVSTSRIAEARQVQPASVTNMVKRLYDRELVHYRKHYGVTLTDEGLAVALEMLRHHRLLELYLTQELGFGWDEVHKEADALEHVISEKLEERIAAHLNYPQFDPHGEPIPSKDGTMTTVNCQPLTDLCEGEGGIVSRIANNTNGELLCYLDELRLVPGAAIQVINIAPFAGPITAQVNGKQIVVGYKAAANVYIKKAAGD
ncbi:MAG TPA: metal-dependent transcriptional regulator [Chloroflexota bacterium]|nr:metal-dependent transcriptional regulator [Chloroflexota bacterium]HUM67684.1 metal-dependent transcriptional regulator [Chloroflexota bacterium]